MLMPRQFPSDAGTLSAEQVEFYRRNGFIRIRGIIEPEEAERFALETLRLREEWLALDVKDHREVFDQVINTWTHSSIMKDLVFHPRIVQAARMLAGVPLRLWHDHILIKNPGKSTPTQFHQDQPYWPHLGGENSLSLWIALRDVPVERGCMTFIPAQHNRRDLAAQDLKNPRSLFALAPDMEWAERVTLPLRAGDCTFHHGRCPHMANANTSDDTRVSVAVIYVDADTRFEGGKHAVTQDLDLKAGDSLEHERFPLI